MKRLSLVWLGILLTGCTYTYDVQLVKIVDGRPSASNTVAGTLRQWNRSITVVLPSGETLEGQYAAVDSSSVGFGTVLGTATPGKGVGTGVGSGMAVGGSGNGYALLKGDRGLLMEMVFSFNPRTGDGF